MRNDSRRSTRGSVLLVAMLFAALIAISITSYISLANNSLRQASRSFYSGSCMNLAEIGLERAMACFNQLDDSGVSAAWTGWTFDNTPYHATSSPFTPSATRVFSGFSVGPGAEGSVKVYVQHYTGTPATAIPRIVVESTITQKDAPPIRKFVEVILRKRSLLEDGLIAMDDIRTVGTFIGKSWDSDPDRDSATPPVAYTEAANTANLTVASVNGDISMGSNGEIWGYAKVGDGDDQEITGGVVHGLNQTTNDPTRRTNDFDAYFPMPETPVLSATTLTTTLTSATTFPLNAGDLSHTVDGKQTYYYRFDAGAGITLNGPATKVLTVAANKNVVLILNSHAGTSAITVGGSASIQIEAGGTLQIFSNGNIDIGGGGLLNANLEARSFILNGTRTDAGQTITLNGNGQITGVVYAPTASVSMNGGGTEGKIIGAVVGKSITFTGNTKFFYDEALSRITFGNPYGASKWRELKSAAERAAYASVLRF